MRTPPTDHGSVPTLRFSSTDAHVKMREVMQRELAVSELVVAHLNINRDPLDTMCKTKQPVV
jgi:hypothetical protein